MTTRPQGKYRTKRPEGMEDDVWVDDGNISMDIPESRYVAKGYEPPLETLPWGNPDA